MADNFCARIVEAAERYPAHVAMELAAADGGEALTYRDLCADAARWAAWLAVNDVAPGDRCALLADNSPRWVAAYLGVLWRGAAAVPLDTAYKAAQVRTVLESSGARVLFTTTKYLSTARSATEAMGAAAPRLVLMAGSTAGLTGPDDRGAAGVPLEPATVTLDDMAVILYTSGTTADPKGVVLTHGNLDAERRAALAIVDATHTDALLGVLPLFHALAQMANLLLPLTVGARVVFLETVSSTTLLEALQTRGITIFACVPQFFYLIHQRVTTELAKATPLRRAIVRTLISVNVRLRDTVGWNPGKRVFAKVHHALGPSMRLLITGGSRFDAAIGRDLYGMGFTLLNAYGLTETSGGATIQRPGDRFTTSVGQPFPGVDVTIADPAREPGAGLDDPREDGEILIRGPIVMREYFQRPDATAEAIKDGWLHTGDLGRLDEQGRLFITGRSKEIIVLSSGKNLYPEEIEAHYRHSTFIKELCVLGLSRPGEPAAERLHALIVPDDQALRDRGIVNLRELMRFEIETQSAQLPAHKRILTYDISLDPLPRTTTGKVRRPEVERRVRAQAASAETRADAPLSDDDRAWLARPGHAALMQVLAARLDRPAVAPDANLELDLMLDSLERVELLTALERTHGSRVPADVRATIFNVRQLVEAVVAAPQAEGGTSDAEAIDQPWEVLLREPPDAAATAILDAPRGFGAVVPVTMVRLVGLIARGVLRLRVRGREHLPASGPFLICPNHQTFFDGPLLASALPLRTLRQIFVVGAPGFFKGRFMGWVARNARLIPVDPDANLVRAMQASAAGLRKGQVLILFPEGERSIDGTVKRFRKGAAILASHLQAPIVPVAITGAFAVWPRGKSLQWSRLLPWRVQPVTIEFGAPLAIAGENYEQEIDRVRNAVHQMSST